jgi:hypothetical protein
MIKTTPRIEETPFDIEELFFSRTDKKGIIESFNEVFVKISQYNTSELIHAPHNIVRHPDMPKAVFKLLWDTISNNKPIGAYVKNMSKSGSFYWVFALAIPVQNGFISVRLKPSTQLLTIVENLYLNMRATEVSNGIQASTQVLTDALLSLKIESYDHFMSTALLSELQNRDKVLAERTNFKSPKQQVTDPTLPIEKIRSSFEKLALTTKSVATIQDEMRLIKTLSSELSYLSINLSACTERMGMEGKTLSEVANKFRILGSEIISQVAVFELQFSTIFTALTSAQFDLGACRLLSEMIISFKNESEQTDTSRATDQTLLLATTRNAIQESIHKIGSLLHPLNQFVNTLTDLMAALRNLEIIRITGKIESAKLSADLFATTTVYIETMGQFLNKILPLFKSWSQSGQFCWKQADCIVAELKAAVAQIEQLN